MKLSDYLIGQLADWGVRHIFLVTAAAPCTSTTPLARKLAFSSLQSP